MVTVLNQLGRTDETYLERHGVRTVGRLADSLVYQIQKLLGIIPYQAGKKSLVLRTAFISQELGKT